MSKFETAEIFIEAEKNSSRNSTAYSKCPVCGRGGEPPVPLMLAAREIGLPVWKLRRAAKAGAFPTYKLHDSKTLCFVSEIRAAILATRREGGQ